MGVINDNLTILISGASKGVGRFLFDTFAENGFRVYGTYYSTVVENELLTKVDVSNYDSVERWIDSLGDLRNIVLINCAGITDGGFLHKSNPEIWSKVLTTNVVGSYNTIRSVLPKMRQQKFGRIINFSSVVTKIPTPGVSAYAASKAALIGMTKTISVENGALGVTANALCLGYVEAGMGINDVSSEYREKMISKIPSGRFCNPIEIYNTILWIIQNEYVNGSDIDLNGGIV